MSIQPLPVFAAHPIALDSAALRSTFAADGLSIVDPAATVIASGVLGNSGASSVPATILDSVRGVAQGGVQATPAGAVQDPAGSAIGDPRPPGQTGAGGGSRAIYQKFPDLEPIPTIVSGAAVFNTATGSGRRVLHSYSPQLGGRDPDQPGDCVRSLADLANAYLNAFAAFSERSSALGDDGQQLNLVPLSARLYAGRFVSTFAGVPHLHPSYTLTAVLLAAAQRRHTGEALPHTALYYYDEPVYRAAAALASTL